jgi:hypothetical protein
LEPPGLDTCPHPAQLAPLLADDERMALPRQDPWLPRMPAWAFAVLMAWLAFIAYLVVVEHARWASSPISSPSRRWWWCESAGLRPRVLNIRFVG